MPSEHTLQAGGSIGPDVVRHVVVDKRIEFLGDEPFAVGYTGHEARAIRGVGGATVPHLVVEHIGVTLACEKRVRLITIKHRMVLFFRTATSIVTARDHLRRSVFNLFHIGERRKNLHHEAWQRYVGIMTGNMRW